MPPSSGSFHIGPENATLTIRTGTAGAMAKAGHSLQIRVSAWSAQLELTEDPTSSVLSLDVDSGSLEVIDGSGGPKPLTDSDRVKIAQTINDKVLKRGTISFRSSTVQARDGEALAVHGDLTLLGSTRPVHFDLTIDDRGHLSASAEIVQTAFGIEPYSTMLGALKVKDELLIEVDGQLPSPG
jgi:polyisoprenoid-binding protein YceI